MEQKQQIINRIKKIDAILNIYRRKENDGSIIGYFVDNFFDILDGGYSEKESYHHKKSLEEEREKLLKKIQEIQNYQYLEDIFNKLDILVKKQKLTKIDAEKFKEGLKKGSVTVEKVQIVIDGFNINFIENSSQEKFEDKRILGMIAVFVKLSQKKGEIFLPRDQLRFKNIMKEKFKIDDLSMIDKLFKLDTKKIEPLTFLKEMYDIYPKEVEDVVRELTKLDSETNFLDSEMVKKLRIEVTKLKQNRKDRK